MCRTPDRIVNLGRRVVDAVIMLRTSGACPIVDVMNVIGMRASRFAAALYSNVVRHAAADVAGAR